MREERNIIGAFLALGELRKHEEALPTPSFLSYPHTLNAYRQRIEVTLSHSTSFHDTDRAQPSKEQKDERQDDTAGKDPPRICHWDVRLDLTTPSVKSKEIDSSEGVNSIDGDGDKNRDVQDAIGQRRPTCRGMEVVEILYELASCQKKIEGILLTIYSHFCSVLTLGNFLRNPQQPIL